ncbi:MAG: geranyl transferase [Pelagibacteraceae bacterium]|nr:geranyl transferase [Pelagibacteraceae bacterium]|tara:strand:- start:1706 stop:2590 length:885 start_codon:yes stop_codon:yes gene_type:complete
MISIENQLLKFKKTFDIESKKELSKIAKYENNIYNSIQYSFSTGGKRLRPFLIFFFGKLLKINQKTLFDLSMSAELTHTYSLIHDDLPAMDNDDYRRGKPTVHKKFNEAVAILCGDALQVISFYKISNSKNISEKNKSKIINLLCDSSGVRGLISGQSLDLKMDNKSSLSKIDIMQDLKTGALFRFCFVSIGIIKNLPVKKINILNKISIEFGKIFQTTDDLLDLTGDYKKVGKKLRKDFNKPNIAYKLGRDKCLNKISKHQKKFINYCKLFGFNEKEITEISLLMNYVSNRDF